jgi:hypothetical protein
MMFFLFANENDDSFVETFLPFGSQVQGHSILTMAHATYLFCTGY